VPAALDSWRFSTRMQICASARSIRELRRALRLGVALPAPMKLPHERSLGHTSPVTWLTMLGLVTLAACLGETTDPGQVPSGTLRILMRTVGATFDPDGYTYRIGSSNITLALQDSQEVRELPVGRAAVGLSGLANNCRAFSYGPDSVTIDSREIARVSLVVSCDSALHKVILYEHRPGAGRPEIWMMRPDGTGKQRFLADAEDPAPTPTGTEVVYFNWKTLRLSIIRADHEYLRAAVPGVPGGQYRPDVSPDGRSVVFEQFTSEVAATRIYRADIDGTGILQLTDRGSDFEPRWSPDGRFITFSRVDEDVQVYRIPAGGGDAVRLTTFGVCCARWSPEGERLLFSGGDGLWTMTPDGADAGPLQGMPPASYAEWSPDGTEILMERVLDGGAQIWRVPLSGQLPVQLTAEGENVLGRWLP
jgi:WD40 repeat protein